MNENEKGIEINGVDVSECNNIIFEHHDGRAKRINVCECGLQGVEFHNMMCSDNPDCYYKQLQREQQKNEILINEIETQNNIEDKLAKDINVLHKTLKEIKKYINNFCDNCDWDETDIDCASSCRLNEITGPILQKIKEVENE